MVLPGSWALPLICMFSTKTVPVHTEIYPFNARHFTFAILFEDLLISEYVSRTLMTMQFISVYLYSPKSQQMSSQCSLQHKKAKYI